MKAAAFDYVRAADIDEVCRLLADAGGEERKIIAGGQTLVPLMAMRMARPDMLIDINDVPGLSGIEDEETYVAIGGCTRQRARRAAVREASGTWLQLVQALLATLARRIAPSRG